MDTNLIILIAMMAAALVGLLIFSRSQRAQSIERAVKLARKAHITKGQVFFVADGGRKVIDILQVSAENRRRHERGWLIEMREEGNIWTAELGEGMDPDEILKDRGERFTLFTEA